jgi:hypothetical protein
VLTDHECGRWPPCSRQFHRDTLPLPGAPGSAADSAADQEVDGFGATVFSSMTVIVRIIDGHSGVDTAQRPSRNTPAADSVLM